MTGGAGDWLVYEAPGGLELAAFDLSVWNPTETPGLQVFVSADGNEWQNVTPTPEVHDYKPYYAKAQWAKIRATEHHLESDQLPRGMRLVKFHGQAKRSWIVWS